MCERERERERDREREEPLSGLSHGSIEVFIKALLRCLLKVY